MSAQIHIKQTLITILFLCFLFVEQVQAQEDLFNTEIKSYLEKNKNEILYGGRFTYTLSIGIAVDLGKKRNGSLRGFFSFSGMKNISNRNTKFILGGQAQLEFFRGGLGSSIIDKEKSKINISLRNNIMMLTGYDRGMRPLGKPGFVTVNNHSLSMYDPLDYSISFGTTFINGINHDRHQQIGTFSASIHFVQIQYYNDATPFNKIALSDNFDRYWTGGGSLGFYWNNDRTFFTDFLWRYDNYTGYQRNLYEVSGLLNIDNLPYKDPKQQMFNQARYQYKLGVKNFTHLNYSVYEPIYTDIQNLIHYRISKSPFHPRPLGRRQVIGFEYQNIYR